jgi:hypothetical protein
LRTLSHVVRVLFHACRVRSRRLFTCSSMRLACCFARANSHVVHSRRPRAIRTRRSRVLFARVVTHHVHASRVPFTRVACLAARR